MSVLAHDRESVLSSQGGNPDIVLRNRFAALLQFKTDRGVNHSRLAGDLQHSDGLLQKIKLGFEHGPFARAMQAKPKFAEDDNRQAQDRLRFD